MAQPRRGDLEPAEDTHFQRRMWRIEYAALESGGKSSIIARDETGRAASVQEGASP